MRSFGKDSPAAEAVRLPATTLIGLPLEYISHEAFYDGFQLARMGHSRAIINKTVRTLSVDFDPNSKTFGQPLSEGRGTYIVERVSGDDLTVKEIQAAEAFIKARLLEWYQLKPSAKDAEKGKEGNRWETYA